MFRPIPPDVDFVALENDELGRWATHDVFARSVAQREGCPPWIFYEGPPTANGKPGLHHVWARIYKDLFCRFRTMRGHYVARRAGWDTHGLPVEVEVEKRLGIGGKRQIEEEVGIAEFVRLCRESVLSYVDDWRELTVRIGYWVDFDDAYWTLNPGYIESVWWHLRQMFDQGLLYEDIKVVPYCPRCGTGLSSHELGQPDVYRDEEDESAFVRFSLVDADPATVAGATSLLVWTTTPWTLVSNTAVAMHPDLTYAVVDGMLIADGLVEAVMGSGAVVTGRVPGRDLVGLRYRRPFDLVDADTGADGWRVVAADFVTTEEGTGLVHMAPAFGEIDRQVGKDNGLPTINPVGPDGRFTAAAGWLSGREVREANHDINDALEAEGLLERRLPYVHSYPHCWRCRTPLIYWGTPELVRGHLDAQGGVAGGQPHHRLAPLLHPRRPFRRVVGQQRGLGPVAGPLLGHPAADLALRLRTRDLHRLARRALRAHRSGPLGARPAPARHRRGGVPLPGVRARRCHRGRHGATG